MAEGNSRLIIINKILSKYNSKKIIKTTSRLFEQILGIVGSVLAVLSGSLFLFLESWGMQGNSFIAILSIIGAILGFISSFYVSRDNEYAGVGFIASAVLILISTSHLGILSSILLLIAGISALFRK